MKDFISNKINEYIDKILYHNHSEKEWLLLETEINEFMKNLTVEQCEPFEESGAGELLYMICSGIRKKDDE